MIDLNFIKKHEGLRLKAYPDPASGGEPWTIGYGNTFYPPSINGGRKVKEGDQITQNQADEILKYVVDKFMRLASISQPLNANQKTAMASLIYNIGVSAFNRSTVLRLINENPNNPKIREAILMWRNAGSRPMLLNRRIDEANLYFKK